MPIKTYIQALNEATEQLMRESDKHFLIGEGVTDPKGCFGSTKGLEAKFPGRVFDMPVSENGMTGVCIGAAISGMRPMMVHMRPDFLMYAMDQIVNSAAKIHSMYGGQLKCPIVIRAIVGRGFGQGTQHSQHLEHLFTAIPGLQVYYPYNAYTAKGLLIKAARGNNPVIFLEHRWLHQTVSEVPDEMYECEDQADIIKPGPPIVAYGYMVTVVRKALEFLEKQEIRLGLHAHKILTRHTRNTYEEIKHFTPMPPAPNLSVNMYTSVIDVMKDVAPNCDISEAQHYINSVPQDIPHPDFKGPF